MNLDQESCYQALLAHDPRFDGAFFVAVRSTGVYCRTVCPARTPRRENCAFYPSAAAAERAGYRPCLRCRPELAPGNARVDALGRLAAAALDRIESGMLSDAGVAGLADDLGVTDRHLRRIVKAELGVSPIELAQTQRLLLAKRLLTDTALPVTEVAFASGFSSVRRFNALFQERYRLNPSEVRRNRRSAGTPDSLRFEVAYRPPFDWNSLLLFLAQRASQGVEVIADGVYRRTVQSGRCAGWVQVQPHPVRNTLVVELSSSLAGAAMPVLAGVKRQFDLSAEPQRISEHLGELAAYHPGLRVPGAIDGFETTVRSILGQQVSVKAASTLAGRVAARFGEAMESAAEGLTHLSPSPEAIARAEVDQLTALGLTAARAHCVLALARAVAEGRVLLEPQPDVEAAMAQLQELPGIGEWTAHYVAMRVFAWPDAFPHSDLGIRKALGERSPRQVLQFAESWRPWRAYAAMHLWKSLEER